MFCPTDNRDSFAAWPFGFVETVWTAVALRRWVRHRHD
jgi:hypothetical protein